MPMLPLPQDVAVVVPCYNAGPRVRAVIDALLDVVPRVVLVDDGSTDDSVAGLGELPIEMLSFPENRGKGHALIAGYRKALEDPKTNYVAVVDADGQHDPADLPKLYKRMKSDDADFVIGAREFGGEHVPWRSRFGNRLTIAVTGWLLGQRVSDTQSGYRLLSRRFLETVLPEMPGGRYETEMELLARAIAGGFRVSAVPIRTIYETGNPSSHFRKVGDSLRIYLRLGKMAWRFRRRAH